MHHPLEIHAEEALARLRDLRSRAPVVLNQHIVPGVWVAADTEQGQIEMEIAHPADPPEDERSGPEGEDLLAFDVRVARPGRWLSLNIALDDTPLAEGDVLGLVADMRCDVPAQIAVTVRSSHDGKAEDIGFADRLDIGPAGAVRVALLRVAAGMALTRRAEWRNLMLWLPQKDMRLTLAEMRLFLAPAGG